MKHNRIRCFKVFSRPQIDLNDMLKFEKSSKHIQENDLDKEIIEQTEIQVKYSEVISKKNEIMLKN